MQKILFISDMSPSKNFTGGIMNAQLIRFLLEEKNNIDITYYCIEDKYIKPDHDYTAIDDVNFIYKEKPAETICKENEQTEFTYNYQKRKIIRDFEKYLDRNKFDKIMLVIQGEILTEIAYSVLKKGLPYVVEVWDPIEWWTKEHLFSEKREKKVIYKYNEVLKHATKCITVSKAMSEYYKKTLGIDCVEVMPPLKRKVIEKIRKDKNKFVIALSGQVYAEEELKKLFQALDLLNWKLNNKKVYFEYYGGETKWDNFIAKDSKYKDRVIIHGFINQNELLVKLNQVDLLYCPYFFSDNEILKKVATLSFPSKLITYLSLPVVTLVHGPEYANPVKFVKSNKCAYAIISNNPEQIAKELEKIATSNNDKIIENAHKTFDKNFSYEVVKKNLFKALDIKYDPKKKLRILEVNNIDLQGRRFNGYDLLDVIDNETPHRAHQIITYKSSDDNRVKKFYSNQQQLNLEWQTLSEEANELSVHSQLSITSNILKNNEFYTNADVVHYHLIHNTKLNFHDLIEMAASRPTILTFHDLWNFTGRCVHPHSCEKWKTGCENCQYLDTLFPFKEDNCHSLWELKKKVYKNMDIDIVVSTPFMMDLVKTSPLTSHFKHVHYIPFGVDLDYFNEKISKEKAREKLGLPQDEVVLFFRAQAAMKGTEYIVEAMKMLNIDKKITLLSCSETGLLDSLKDKYNVVDLGVIQNEELLLAYRACDFFLMPSKAESFGLMAIEAMACGKTVVVFNNTALPSVTHAPECGVLVEDRNSKELCKAIKNLIENPEELERRNKLSRKIAEENYDVHVYNDKIKKLYEEVYTRQKDNIIKPNEIKIDYDNINSKAIIYHLNKIYKNIFETDDNFYNLSKKDTKELKDYKIDYSDDNVQAIISKFNDKLYEKYLKLEEEYRKTANLSKMELTFHLLRYDRPRLIQGIDRRLNKIPVVYQIYKLFYYLFRPFYRLLRKIKALLRKIKGKR